MTLPTTEPVTTSQKCIAKLYGHEARVWRACWVSSLDSGGGGQRLLASASEDATCRLWDVETEQCLSIMSGMSAANARTADTITTKRTCLFCVG
jgi:WD40 repeat protein